MVRVKPICSRVLNKVCIEFLKENLQLVFFIFFIWWKTEWIIHVKQSVTTCDNLWQSATHFGVCVSQFANKIYFGVEYNLTFNSISFVGQARQGHTSPLCFSRQPKKKSRKKNISRRRRWNDLFMTKLIQVVKILVDLS